MTDVAELFSRDPLSLTTQDLDAIIEHLRRGRTNFNLGQKDAGSMKPKTAKPKVEKVTGAAALDLLKDLGL